MKKFTIASLLLLTITSYSQTLKTIEKELNEISKKRTSLSDRQNSFENSREFSDSLNLNLQDSLDKYNAALQKLVLKFASTNPKSFDYDFKKLKNDLFIHTSADGQFRIYNWDNLNHGTMKDYKSVFQYKTNGKVYAKLNKPDAEMGEFFLEVNEVKTDAKHYYITNSVKTGSNAAYYYESKIFSIEKGKLNENRKLIKTKNGMQNCLKYEVALGAPSNSERTDGLDTKEYMELYYDKKNNTIVIPQINKDLKITKNKIKYKFNGKFFEKI
jgi:hypothetical protein